MKTVVLVGHPNSGKTTLFNRLTGLNQQVGNWPGVTVDCKQGYFNLNEAHIHVIDLPGCYTLHNPSSEPAHSSDTALDHYIASQFIQTCQADCLINVVSACELSRHLYLTMQLLEQGMPIILVVNRIDQAKKAGIKIDISSLEAQLGCPVLATIAHLNHGVEGLKQTLLSGTSKDRCKRMNGVDIAKQNEGKKRILFDINEYFEQDFNVARTLKSQFATVSSKLVQKAASSQQTQKIVLNEQSDASHCIDEATARYAAIEKISKRVISTEFKVYDSTDVQYWIDRLILNRVLGLPIFLAVMYGLFVFALDIGGFFQHFFDTLSSLLLVDGLAYGLHQWHAPDWIVAVLAHGVGRGLNTIVTFIPVLAGLYFGLGWLEESGYMSRAAFVMDKIMQSLGLPGQSFVPLLIGVGCNVPAILSSRTLNTHRERILTIMMTPFMSCSARLAIYTVFTAAFFPHHRSLVILMLYLTGGGAALLTGFILRLTLLKANTQPLVLELPRYQWPSLHALFKQTAQRLKSFVYRAGYFIVPTCMILGMLSVLNGKGELVLVSGGQGSQALIAELGHWVTPLLKPLGIGPNNWPAAVSLLTGIVSKEVMIGTLYTLYDQSHAMVNHTTLLSWHGMEGIKQAFYELFSAIRSIPYTLAHPLLAAANPGPKPENYVQMLHYFSSQAQAFAYLVFVLLYIPCVSTILVIRKELSFIWACFSMLWNIEMAYALSTLIYRLTQLQQAPVNSLSWMIGMMMVVVITVLCFAHYANKYPLSRHIVPRLNLSSFKTRCAQQCLGCQSLAN